MEEIVGIRRHRKNCASHFYESKLSDQDDGPALVWFEFATWVLI